MKTIRIKDETHARLKFNAFYTGMTIPQYVESITPERLINEGEVAYRAERLSSRDFDIKEKDVSKVKRELAENLPKSYEDVVFEKRKIMVGPMGYRWVRFDGGPRNCPGQDGEWVGYIPTSERAQPAKVFDMGKGSLRYVDYKKGERYP